MRTLLTATAVLILIGCDTPRYAYSPNAHNVPVLLKQGDTKLSANYSTNLDLQESNNQYSRNRSHGYDLQGAGAVTNHFAVQGSYFSRSERSYGNSYYNADSSVVRYRRNLVEFGIGYFSTIHPKQKVLFQVFAGAGFGKVKLTDNSKDFNGTPYNRFYNSDIRKIYIEPAIIFKNKEVFAASISTRLSVINFRNVRTDYTQDEKMNFRLDSLNRYAIAFFEPAFVNSFGFQSLPGLRIEYQVGLSLALVNEDFINYRPFNFSVGLVFDIPKLIQGPGKRE